VSCPHDKKVLTRGEDGEHVMRCEDCTEILPISEELLDHLQRSKAADGRPNWKKRKSWVVATQGVPGSEEVA